ncbi:MAG: peptidoglycan DD-metalloendopeptidase family protein [Frankiales bacterium]|nr:peptidoglycan DD-metalloendopeptidase family protein [Frankiales bacterium]
MVGSGAGRARLRTLVALLLVVAAVGVPTASPAGADTDIKKKVAAASDDLAQASKAVTRAAEALQRARTQLPAAEAALAAALTAQTDARRAAAAAEVARSRATAAVATAHQRLVAARQRIVDMNGQIGDLARAVYTQGPFSELAAIVSAQSPSDFADQLEAIRTFSRSQNRALADLEAAKAAVALANVQAQQAQTRATAAAAAAQAALERAATAAEKAKAAKASVDALVAERADALAVAAREKAKVKKQYLSLKKEQKRLAELERRAAAAHASSGGSSSATPTGSLMWPIPGAYVVGGVGWRVHPVYGYRSCHTGLDIHGAYGTPIHAAAAGTVIEVLNYGAYGLHTVISHGGALSTMYAHQSSTTVHVGQVVAKGQVIGYVGATGWVTGPHLHFEVHVNGVPYDPMGWFGSPRVPVPCWS